MINIPSSWPSAVKRTFAQPKKQSIRGSVYRSTQSGRIVRYKTVFDVDKINRFGEAKRVEAKSFEKQAESKIFGFKSSREKILSEQEKFRRKRLIGKDRVTRLSSRLSKRRKSFSFEKFETDIFGFKSKARKDIFDFKKKSLIDLNKKIVNINKQISSYRPTKKIKYFESSYVYFGPKGKKTRISFDSGKKYEAKIKKYELQLKSMNSFLTKQNKGYGKLKISKNQNIQFSPFAIGLTKKMVDESIKQNKRRINNFELKQVFNRLGSKRLIESEPSIFGKLEKPKILSKQETKNLTINRINTKPTFYKPSYFKKPLTRTKFKQELEKIYDTSIKNQTSIGQTIKTGSQRRKELQQREIIGFYKKSVNIGRTVDISGEAYDLGTDYLGYALSFLSPSKIYSGSKKTFVKRELERASSSKQFKGIKNPYEAVLQQYKRGRNKKIVSNVKSDFFFSKQLAETGMFIAGGGVTKIATAGSILRAEKPEDVVLPLAIGVGARMFTPFVGGKASSGVTKLNVKFDEYLSKKFGSKLPVLKDVLVPSKYNNLLSESMIAKTAIIGGGGIELLGIQFVPNKQKREYIRNVGFFNSLIPLGYNAGDYGFAIGKYGTIKGISSGTGFASRIFKKDLTPFDVFSAKELMGPKLYSKFSKTGGGTPTFSGTEKEMLARLQGTENYGVGKVFKRFGFSPKKMFVGAGIRIVGGKTGDTVISEINYYESLGNYFTDVLHPIALSNVGLKNKMFKKPASIFYDRFSFSPKKPNVLFTTAKRGVAVNLFKEQKLSKELYEQLNNFYGYKNLDFSFSKDVWFKNNKIVKGKKLGDFEYEKILRKGRPIKTGDFLGAGFSDNVFSSKVMKDFSEGSNIQGFVSSRSRGFGTTKESEVIIPYKVKSKRTLPISRTRNLFKNIGFSDAYIDVVFEFVPMKYFAVKETPLNLLNSGQKMLGSGKKLRLVNKSKSLSKKNNGLVSSDLLSSKSLNGKGGYTRELESIFGSRKNPIQGFFQRTLIPKQLFDFSFSKNVFGRNVSRKQNGYSFSRPVYFSKKNYLRNTLRNIPRNPPGYDIPRNPQGYDIPRNPPGYDIPRNPPGYDIPRNPPRTTKIRLKKILLYKIPKPKNYYLKFDEPKKPLKKIKRNKILSGFQNPALGTFNTFTRRRKNTKWVKVNNKPLPYNKAFNIGLNNADNTIARTVRLKKVGKTYRGMDDPFIMSQKFRRRKSRSKIPGEEIMFVEKTPFLIDTIGEKQGLKSARYAKMRGYSWVF